MPASRGSGHFCRFVNILPTKFSKCVQKPCSLLGQGISEFLVYVHSDLNVFVAQAVLHIFGRGTTLCKHSGMSDSQGVIREVRLSATMAIFLTSGSMISIPLSSAEVVTKTCCSKRFALMIAFQSAVLLLSASRYRHLLPSVFPNAFPRSLLSVKISHFS